MLSLNFQKAMPEKPLTQILIKLKRGKYSRGRGRQKRGGDFKTLIALDDAVSFSNEKQLDVIAVDDALTRLEKLDERQARIVEMKFFGGLTIEEIGEVLDISAATVKREWATAKLLLYKMFN